MEDSWASGLYFKNDFLSVDCAICCSECIQAGGGLDVMGRLPALLWRRLGWGWEEEVDRSAEGFKVTVTSLSQLPSVSRVTTHGGGGGDIPRAGGSALSEGAGWWDQEAEGETGGYWLSKRLNQFPVAFRSFTMTLECLSPWSPSPSLLWLSSPSK